MNYSFTLKSSNKKTGPIPVTTSPKQTCPTTCPHLDTTCYAKWGPLNIHWEKLSKGERGISYSELLEKIKALPDGTLWRHNQAGDLPHNGKAIDSSCLASLVAANKGKKGFTYTHHPMNIYNQGLVSVANEEGFTINLSADDYQQAAQYKQLDIAPVCVVVPHDEVRKTWKVDGVPYSLCPAVYEDLSCLDCKLCANPKRKSVVAFPAHGTKKKEWNNEGISSL